MTQRNNTGRWKRLAQQAKANALEAGQYTCPLCRVLLDYTRSKQPNSAEADHIIPYAQGGQDTLANIRIICRRCNQSRGGKLGNQRSRTKRAATHNSQPRTVISW